MKHFTVLIILFIFFSGICLAQENKFIKRSEIIEEIDGKDYYIHFTKEGQTIDNIAKTYGITTKDIISVNPEIQKGIIPNQILKIPIISNSKIHQVSIKSIDDNNIDNDKKTDNFIFHVVKEKETIYNLEKKYNITENVLFEANPELKNGLKAESIIKIPLLKNQIDTSHQINTINIVKKKSDKSSFLTKNSEYIDYHVVPKETLFGISKKFSIPISELIRINPELKNGLKKDQIIKIPSPSTTTINKTKINASKHEIKQEIIQPVIDTQSRKNINKEVEPISVNTTTKNTEIDQNIDCSEAPKNNMYRVALLLPLYLKEADSIVNDDVTKIKPASAYKSMRFLQFYEGALIAVDSLKKSGLNLKFYVYDVDEDTSKTGNLLRKQEIQKMNLIIGPFYSRNFKKVSAFAKKYNIPIVNPLSPREEILENNPYVLKIQPSNKSGFNEDVNFLKTNYTKRNILVIRYPRTNETLSYFNVLKSELINQENGKSLNFREVNNIADIIKNLQAEPENIILAVSENKAFVLNLLTKLNEKRNDCHITIFGMPAWSEIDMDPSYMQNLNLHLFMPSFVDYNNQNTKNFVKAFRELYKTEPEEDKYAFIGFDVTYYFLRALQQYGNDFMGCMQNINIDPLSTKIHFKNTINGGYENQSVFVIHYKDYKMVDVTEKSKSN